MHLATRNTPGCLPKNARLVYPDESMKGTTMYSALSHSLRATAISCCAVFATPAQAQNVPPGDWWTIDRDLAGSRYSPLTEIDRSNVSDLAESWRFELSGNSTAVPLAVDGIIYVSAGTRVVALDGANGELIWSYSPPGANGRPGRVSTRGVSYWPGDADHGARILLTSGAELVAIEAAAWTGAAPRQRGSSEGWMLMQPQGAAERTAGPSF